jgi:hypothetical protein
MLCSLTIVLTIIYCAIKEFTEGVEIMKLTKSRDEGNMIGYEGQPTVCIMIPISLRPPTEVIWTGSEHYK